MIRLSKLQVDDEIDNGLAYYRYTFLAEVPRLYLALERRSRAARSASARRCALPPFLRLGSWIGGDRDGNPFVIADDAATTRSRAQATRRVRALPRRDPPARRRAVAVDAARAADAGAAGARRRARTTTNPHRADEPYRQALIGIYARARRDGAGARRLRAAARAARRRCRRTRRRTSSLADLATIEASLATHGAAPLAAGRLVPLMRAVEVFGFHLAALDLRQNADVHEAVVAELLARAGVAADYAALAEAERVALLARELASPRLLHSPHLDVFASASRSELAILDAAARHPSPLRRGGAAELRDLEVPVGVRPARGRACC